MDIVAKHIPADEFGVRIAELDEMTYRKELWAHTPITDFWRVGKGIANRLATKGMFTMGDIARMSLEKEQVLYDLFGVDAEILIDHAWGYEPVGMKEIKGYKSQQKGLGSGQVLTHPYEYEKAKIVVREMAELLALDLYQKNLLTSSVTLVICYDRESIVSENYEGETVKDPWGRLMPKPVHGSSGVGEETNSSAVIVEAFMKIYERIVDPSLLIRRININANNLITPEQKQPGLFDDEENAGHEKEDKLQEVRLNLMKKFGKNAILKGMNFEDGATTRERNSQIGGHKA